MSKLMDWQEATDNWIKATLERYDGFKPLELNQVFIKGPFAGWSEREVYGLALELNKANQITPRNTQ